MKKKCLSLLFAVYLVIGLIPQPTTAFAAASVATSVAVGGVTLTSSAPYATTSGGTVTLGGNESNYNVKFEADTGTLTLKDASISGSNAFQLTWAKGYCGIGTTNDLVIVLEGTSNTVTGTAYGSGKDSIGIFCGGNLTISGTGSLNVTGTGGDTSYGIRAERSLVIQSGIITVNAENASGMDCGVYGSTTINGGTGMVTGGNNVFQNDCAFYYSLELGIGMIKTGNNSGGSISWEPCNAHNYDQEVATTAYRKSSADCENAAVYYKSCSCGVSSKGAASEATFTSGNATGHTYDKEVATDTYLKSSADCENAAVYYKSCSCGVSSKGATSEATFTSGNANGHSHGTDWKSDKDNHWHECSCGDKADLTAHTPKTVNAKEASTSEKGYTGDTVCSVCGYGIATGQDIPVKSESTPPETGDNSNMLLWISLLSVSCFGVIGVNYFGKKRKAAK